MDKSIFYIYVIKKTLLRRLGLILLSFPIMSKKSPIFFIPFIEEIDDVVFNYKIDQWVD